MRKGTAFAIGALMMIVASAPAKAPAKAERGLLGIYLFDPSIRVLNAFGSPDSIEAVNVGSGNAAGGGMGAGGRGGFGAPGGAPSGGGRGPSFGPRGGAGGGGGSPAFDWQTPFGFGDDILQKGAGGGFDGGGGPGMPPGAGGPPGYSGPGGRPGAGGYPGMPGGGAPGGGSTPGGAPSRGGFGGAAEATSFTRWIYNRNGSKYGFIIDKFGRVVQIEAIGLQNAKVKTSQGVGFGATFATVMKKYANPDGYEISGDTIVMKYLSKARVAFRLSRLQTKKPQVVTGIVVAAGKG